MWLTLFCSLALAQDPAVGTLPGTAIDPTMVVAAVPTRIDLAYKLVEGRTVAVEQTVVTAMTTPFGPQSTSLVTRSEQKATKGGVVGKDAVAWTETFIGADVAVDMAGEKVNWTSGKGDAPGGMEGLTKLIGSEWTVAVSPDLVPTVTLPPVVEVDAKIKGAGGFEGAYTAASIEQTIRAELQQLGPLSLNVGESKERTVKIPLGTLGEVSLKLTLTLDKIENGQAWLSEKVGVDNLPKSELLVVKSLAGTGVVVWDVANAMPQSRKVAYDIGLEIPGKAPIALTTRVESSATYAVK